MMALRWWHMLLVTSAPLWRTTSNSSRTRHNWEFPRIWVEVEAPPQTTWTKKEETRRVRQIATLRPHCLSWDQCSTMQRGLPWALIPLVGKREPRGDKIPSALWVTFVGAPALISHHGSCRRISGVQLLGILLPWRKEKGLAATSIWIMTDKVHTCSTQLVILTRGFAHL